MARAPCLALAPAHPTCLAHNLWAFQLHCYGDLPGRQGRDCRTGLLLHQPRYAWPSPLLRSIKAGSSSSASFMDLRSLDDRNTTHHQPHCLHRPLQISGFADSRSCWPQPINAPDRDRHRPWGRRVAARATTAGITVTIARCGYFDLPPDPVEGGRGARAVHHRRSASRRRSKGHSRAVLLAG
jgi:hypothetical protein